MPRLAAADFYSLALGEPVQIAASHGRGIPELLERVDELLPPELRKSLTKAVKA